MKLSLYILLEIVVKRVYYINCFV